MQDRYRIGATSFVNVTCPGEVGVVGAFCPAVTADATVTTKAMADRRKAERKNGWLRTTVLIANLPNLTEIAKSLGASVDAESRNRRTYERGNRCLPEAWDSVLCVRIRTLDTPIQRICKPCEAIVNLALGLNSFGLGLRPTSKPEPKRTRCPLLAPINRRYLRGSFP